MIDRAIQGNADGLCELYCLVNFLLLKRLVVAEDPYNARQNAFRQLLESADRLHLLRVAKILNGYEWPELIEIFNHFAERYLIGFRAVSFRTVMTTHRCKSNISALIRVIESDGAAVVLIRGGRHWVLVHGQSGNEFAFLDSSYEPERKTLRRTSNIGIGLALVPTNSAEFA